MSALTKELVQECACTCLQRESTGAEGGMIELSAWSMFRLDRIIYQVSFYPKWPEECSGYKKYSTLDEALDQYNKATRA